jgi:hypothetical protein
MARKVTLRVKEAYDESIHDFVYIDKVYKYADIVRGCKVAYTLSNVIRELNNEEVGVPFEALEEPTKMLYIDNAIAVLRDPFMSVEDNHNVWMDLRIEKGWKYGTTANRHKKISDCLVPFEKLSNLQKLKDVVFIDTIHCLVHGRLI